MIKIKIFTHIKEMIKLLQLQKYCAKYEYISFELLETKLLLDDYRKIFIEEYSKITGQDNKNESKYNVKKYNR
jgi:5-bromo-4-chloroindolyl phosphate hydrolysis protein